MWVLMHVKGCGEACFKRLTKPKTTDPVVAEPCRNLNGSQILATDPIICQSCGKTLGIYELHPDYWREE